MFFAILFLYLHLPSIPQVHTWLHPLSYIKYTSNSDIRWNRDAVSTACCAATLHAGCLLCNAAKTWMGKTNGVVFCSFLVVCTAGLTDCSVGANKLLRSPCKTLISFWHRAPDTSKQPEVQFL